MTQCIAEPISRSKLRKMAMTIRILDGSENDMFFDIAKFLEVKLYKIDPTFNFRVLAKLEMGECHGLTFPDRNEIQIREDVYDRAVKGSGRDRMTMAHELGHLLFHEKQNISYACMRTNEDVKIPIYRNPEWQADAFGGELLVPHHLIGGKSLDEVSKECGVSLKAAMCQLGK